MAGVATGPPDTAGSRRVVTRALPALTTASATGVPTTHRYVGKVADLSAELAPDLREATRIAQRNAYVFFGSALVATDRPPGARDRLRCFSTGTG